MLREVEIDPTALKDASRIDRLGNLVPKNITISTLLLDISNYALDRPGNVCAPLKLDEFPSYLIKDLAESLRTLITTRQQVFVSLAPVSCLPVLQEFFGVDRTTPEPENLIHTIGPEFMASENARVAQTVFNMGFEIPSDTAVVPVAISPSAWCQSWCKTEGSRMSVVHRAFDWVESVSISSKNYKVLKEAGIRIIPSSKAYRMVRSPKFWAYAVVFLYSSLRALPVMFVKSFHGNLWILWGMDVITAIPYTWGLLAFVTAHRFWVRYLGLLVTLITFISPYVYFWTHGRDYPLGVNAIVVSMIVAAFLYEARNFFRDRKIADGLSGSCFKAAA